MTYPAQPRAWITLTTAIVTMFFLGSIYAYGILLTDIMRAFGWESSTAALPQAVLLFVYAVGMGIGGVLQDRLPPSRIAIAGGFLFGLGLILASVASSLPMLVLAYGLCSGIGFGFAYVACVTAAMRSYPTRRGLSAGLVVGAFGLSSVVWALLAQRALPTLGWHGEMLRFGIITIVLLPLLGFGIRVPWHHEIPGEHPDLQGHTLAQAVRTPLFWVVFAAYTLVTAAGLLWLNHYKVFGGSQGIPAAQAAWLVALTSVGSGVGRISIGWLSDRIGRFPALLGASLLAIILFVVLAVGVPPLAIFVISVLIGFAFGTWLALYGPTSTDLFGMRAAGAIYGALYLSYGIGGLLGPLLGGYLADIRGGDYRLAFLLAGGWCLLGVLLFALAAHLNARMYRHPSAAEEQFPV